MCGVAPLLSVGRGRDCNWGTSGRDTALSVSGMRVDAPGNRWAMLYMDRSVSSQTTPDDLLFPYAGLVRLTERELREFCVRGCM